jgi:hypothetical protein
MRLRSCKGNSPCFQDSHRAGINAALQRTVVDLLALPGYWVASILVLFQAQTCNVSSGKLE